MNRKDVERILQTIAQKEGVSVRHIREDIQEAINIGMANSDPAVQRFWQSVPQRGNHPSPEDVICFLVEKVFMGLG